MSHYQEMIQGLTTQGFSLFKDFNAHSLASQRLVEQKDGGVILTLKVAHLLEVRRWALSRGGACEVLEPAALREEMRHEAEQLARYYGRRE